MSEHFGDRIRRLRLARNWSQQELGLRCGISAPHISSIERGKRYPSLDYAIRMAAALGVPLNALCDETIKLKPPKMRSSPEELPTYLQNFILNEAATPYLQAAHKISTLPEADREFLTKLIDLVVQQRQSPQPTA
ncbi:helix-turn-helix transcriptional regulator [Alicyclobacillus sp.]|uniref:helix-turn-helix domain-containing protein n=1 Tax=Alicyclobacillus sp. TaxID=61169 RepID=UPI0025C162E6|nr:helix-turn-helix transcriptional regulator [Alicyclobacillus sp.]MCL6515750.1 helix-turn-helix transcriptional regulator [Alicyclobacillus sp.]